MSHSIMRMSMDDYLLWEETQSDKHEFVAGEVFAMVGARREHVTVALNIAALLKDHLRGGPCRAYISDMKVKVERANAFFYPDVMVTCDARDHQSETFMSHPTLIVEVLSDSTAAFDRGDKFAAYRQIPALKEYVLVDPVSRRADCFRRDATGHWVLHDFKAEETLELASVSFTVAMTALFENVEAPKAPSEPVS